MAGPYLKSIIWLASFGGIGYGLLLITTPSAEKLERIRASSGSRTKLNEDERKKLLFIERLKREAGIKAESNSTPKTNN